MTTPIERAAEALEQPIHAPREFHDQRDGSCTQCPWPLHQAGSPKEMARAALEAALDVDELARIVFEELVNDRRLNVDDRTFALARDVVDALRAHLLGTDEGGA